MVNGQDLLNFFLGVLVNSILTGNNLISLKF